MEPRSGTWPRLDGEGHVERAGPGIAIARAESVAELPVVGRFLTPPESHATEGDEPVVAGERSA